MGMLSFDIVLVIDPFLSLLTLRICFSCFLLYWWIWFLSLFKIKRRIDLSIFTFEFMICPSG